LVYEAKRIADQTLGGLAWLQQMATAATQILVHDGWIPAEGRQDLLRLSVDEMEADMRRKSVDVANLTIADLGLFANPDKAIKLITLHHSKGREFDATALVCVNEGRIPHFSAQTQDEFDEARRLFYVGISRAKKLLLVASDQRDPRDRPSRYIGQCGMTVSA
jgi:DNA helicase-2/ATP-dependent DNA helicase PcrA